MNIEHKKTALDDDSVLYQKRDDTLKKQDISGLNKKQKAVYFRDYYLAKVIVGILIAVFAGVLIYNMAFRHQEDILFAGVIGETYITDTEGLSDSLRDIYGLTDKDQTISIRNYNLENYNEQIAFSTYVAAQALDIVICDKDLFESYAMQGFFSDLSEVFSQEQLDGLTLLESQTAETDSEGNITQYHDAKPYGIDISDNALYSEYGGIGDSAVLCIISNTKRPGNAKIFAAHMLNIDISSDITSESETEN